MNTQQDTEPKPKYIHTDLGKEKLCLECLEYFPLDDEFFFFQWRLRSGEKVKQYSATCKGCYDIRYRPIRKNRKRKNIKSEHEALLR